MQTKILGIKKIVIGLSMTLGSYAYAGPLILDCTYSTDSSQSVHFEQISNGRAIMRSFQNGVEVDRRVVTYSVALTSAAYETKPRLAYEK